MKHSAPAWISFMKLNQTFILRFSGLLFTPSVEHFLSKNFCEMDPWAGFGLLTLGWTPTWIWSWRFKSLSHHVWSLDLYSRYIWLKPDKSDECENRKTSKPFFWFLWWNLNKGETMDNFWQGQLSFLWVGAKTGLPICFPWVQTSEIVKRIWSSS